MSAFPCLPFDVKTLAESVTFILPGLESGRLELYNDRYVLIGLYDESKKELLHGKAIAGVKGYFCVPEIA